MSRKILIACEESQRVTVEMRKLGIEAYSCDIVPTSGDHPEWHFQCCVSEIIGDGWDMIIAFPPCTYLSNVGNRWFNIARYDEKAVTRWIERGKALEFVKMIWGSCDHVAIENPTGWISSWKKSSQTIQPWQFGDKDSKRTCLWLKNLPKLRPTKIVRPKIYGYHKNGASKGNPIYRTEALGFHPCRETERSKTFPGIAKAMAEQWGLAKLKVERQLELFRPESDQP
jgi:hypothetical protein